MFLENFTEHSMTIDGIAKVNVESNGVCLLVNFWIVVVVCSCCDGHVLSMMILVFLFWGVGDHHLSVSLFFMCVFVLDVRLFFVTARRRVCNDSQRSTASHSAPNECRFPQTVRRSLFFSPCAVDR